MNLRHPLPSLTAAAIVGTISIGCGASDVPVPSSTTPPGTPAVSELPILYSHVWKPTPQLDLLSAEGVFVRAFIESIVRGWRAGHYTVTYPGFTHVPTGQYKDKLDESLYWFHAPPTPEAAGAMTWWVHSIHHNTNSFTVLVCEREDDMVFRSLTSHWERSMYPGSTTGRSITVAKSGKQSPPAGAAGTARTPTYDVFGSWTVPHYETLTNECPNPQGMPSKPVYQTLPDDPDNIPSTPGWPRDDPTTISTTTRPRTP